MMVSNSITGGLELTRMFLEITLNIAVTTTGSLTPVLVFYSKYQMIIWWIQTESRFNPTVIK